MPGLTVTEKEHWKERITLRIDKRIETISAEEPNLLDRVSREAHSRALESLGLSALQAESDQIEQQRSAFDKRKRQIDREMLAHIRGVNVDEIEDYYAYRQDSSKVSNAISRRQAVYEDELLAAEPIGQRILRLRQEKENLLDTVWLATSPKQVKELWSKVAELLGDEPTQLLRDALTIAPLEE